MTSPRASREGEIPHTLMLVITPGGRNSVPRGTTERGQIISATEYKILGLNAVVSDFY